MQLVDGAKSRVLRITPDSVKVEKGDSVRFTAEQRLPLGGVRPAPVEFSARGGTITQDGEFVAGGSVGVFHVIASSSDGMVADTAVVVVVSFRHRSRDDLTSKRGDAGREHQPPGMRRITNRSFARPHEDGWIEGGGQLSFVHESRPPRGDSDSMVGQIRFPAGFTAGGAPAWTLRESLASQLRFRTTYVSFWLKVSDNWYGQQILSKIGYVWIGGKPKFFVALRGSGTGPLSLLLCGQDLAVPSGTDTGLNLVNNLSAGSFSRGQWHHVEFVLVANTAATAAANGQAQWWLDGVPVGTANNIPWVGPGATDTWETFAWTPVWGGLGGTVPADQYMWMDQYYASGK